jgi:ABC-type nickel/cobalt efflux system permease component RcnA
VLPSRPAHCGQRLIELCLQPQALQGLLLVLALALGLGLGQVLVLVLVLVLAPVLVLVLVQQERGKALAKLQTCSSKSSRL